MAPPKQLKPKLWKTKRILRLKDGERVMDGHEKMSFSRAYVL